MSRTPITTTRLQLGEIDVFPWFTELRDRFGPDNVFLLESFSDAPSRDARASFVGFDRLLTVRVTGMSARISGAFGLVTLILNGLDDMGFASDREGEIKLASRESLWGLLRAIRTIFVRHTDDHADLEKLGFFGYFGYDVVHAIESLPRNIPTSNTASDVELSVFRCLIVSDLASGSTSLAIHRAPDLWDDIDYSELLKNLAKARSPVIPEAEVEPPLLTRGTITQDQYESGVRKALHHIEMGDIYQVQLGHELLVQSEADPLAVYCRLRARNPSPYMYVAPFRSCTLIGASPELYVRAEGSALSMRPIAGTTSRGANQDENEQRVDRLMRDEKEVAEHIMLVDLCRNDLGRICVPGTLTVDELLVIERYSHVYHLVSNVSAVREKGHDIYDIIRATFPAGTMTGAPKIRAMEIIEATEGTRRGHYAGAIGMISFNDDANLALCIRTAAYNDGSYWLRASAGIVADSEPGREWNETLHKMAALYWAITDRELTHESIAC